MVPLAQGNLADIIGQSGLAKRRLPVNKSNSRTSGIICAVPLDSRVFKIDSVYTIDIGYSNGV
jgi:hypothetical protein